jgi:hypothetical protein
VQSLPFDGLSDKRVADLIDKDLKCWNEPLIHSVFCFEEAKVISSIPPSPSLPPDRLMWLGTSNGVFSFRSAYYLRMEMMDRNRGQSSNRGKDGDAWGYLWNLQIPNSVKLFLWRACNDILPTRKNLMKRKVIRIGLYPWCS